VARHGGFPDVNNRSIGGAQATLVEDPSARHRKGRRSRAADVTLG
jgi:hypothetical protein